MNEKSESHLTSPAAFVEGGVQDACDDACSICLEAFSESDPSALTNCKHEYHLQCILEWCQRSSQCPMCWQAISLKDATSQELLEAVEQERKFRSTPSRNTTIFRHPTLGDFEIPHLSLGANDIELEERIIQHLAAAAAMGRAHHIARRESQRSRSTAQARQQNMRFSSNPEVAATGPVSSSPANRRGQNEQFPIENSTTPSVPLTLIGEESSRHGQQLPPALADQIPSPASRSRNTANHRGFSFSNMNSPSRSSSANQDGAGPSDFHSFSESLKSRLNSVSMRYKESITKGTRGWKERLFSRNTLISDLGSEVRKEVNAGLASVSRMMELLETRENSRATSSSVSNISDGVSDTDRSNQGIAETHDNTRLTERNTSISCAARSGPN